MESLPPEILSLILIRTLPPGLDDARCLDFDPADTHVLLLSVCQKWNQIAKSTPQLWTFIYASSVTLDHDAMHNRLALSGDLPLNITMRLCFDAEEATDSFLKLHATLVQQVEQWRILRIYGVVESPLELRQWIPSEIPNLEGFSLVLDVFGDVAPADTVAQQPFTSTPRVTFCSSDSPILFPLIHCPDLREYHTMGIGFRDFETQHSRSTLWGKLAATLAQSCPRLQILQVGAENADTWLENGPMEPASWPALPSLKTLKFTERAGFDTKRCILTCLPTSNLQRVEVHSAWLSPDGPDNYLPLLPKILFSSTDTGRLVFSEMSLDNVALGTRMIPNIGELNLEADLPTITDGLVLGPEKMEELRKEWDGIRRRCPKVSWMVRSEDGIKECLGGVGLSFDDAMRYFATAPKPL